jgi:signal transduction histidine kinase
MSEASREKIFTPFFTTKTKGTGLGLSICKRLVEQHGGSIVVHSQVGVGTSFAITLPLTQRIQE